MQREKAVTAQTMHLVFQGERRGGGGGVGSQFMTVQPAGTN